MRSFRRATPQSRNVAKSLLKAPTVLFEILITQERAAVRKLHLAAFTFGIPIASHQWDRCDRLQ
jgi:hypothetical protein